MGLTGHARVDIVLAVLFIVFVHIFWIGVFYMFLVADKWPWQR